MKTYSAKIKYLHTYETFEFKAVNSFSFTNNKEMYIEFENIRYRDDFLIKYLLRGYSLNSKIIAKNNMLHIETEYVEIKEVKNA